MDLYMICLIISILALKYLFGFFLRLSLCHAPLKIRYVVQEKCLVGKYDRYAIKSFLPPL